MNRWVVVAVVFSVIVLMFEQLKAQETPSEYDLHLEDHFQISEMASEQPDQDFLMRPCFKNKTAVATITFANYMKNSYLYCNSKKQGMPLRDVLISERNAFVKKFRKSEGKAYRMLIEEVGEKALLDLDAVINNIMSSQFARNLPKQCKNAGKLFEKTLQPRFSESQLPDFALASKLMPQFYKTVLCESVN